MSSDVIMKLVPTTKLLIWVGLIFIPVSVLAALMPASQRARDWIGPWVPGGCNCRRCSFQKTADGDPRYPAGGGSAFGGARE